MIGNRSAGNIKRNFNFQSNYLKNNLPNLIYSHANPPHNNSSYIAPI
jgi:hypothetical protein